MAAPLGSKNGEKWSEERATKQYQDMLDFLNSDAEYDGRSAKDIRYVGTVLRAFDLYADFFAVQAKRFIKCRNIKLKIEKLLESRRVEGLLDGSLSARGVEFVQRCKHSWSADKDFIKMPEFTGTYEEKCEALNKLVREGKIKIGQYNTLMQAITIPFTQIEVTNRVKEIEVAYKIKNKTNHAQDTKEASAEGK